MFLKPQIADVRSLTDHRNSMAFLDELVGMQEGSARCRAGIRADNPFLVDGMLPPWILIEYMAQSVAAFAGCLRAAEGREHRHGLLIGCRNVELGELALNVGDQLEVLVEETTRLDDFGSFRGTVHCADRQAARGSLLVYECAQWPDPAAELGKRSEHGR